MADQNEFGCGQTGVKQQKGEPYSQIRQDIVELRLKPGMTISIKELCDHYDSSRSPMRDALLRLSQEGLVTLLPQRGTMISRIDLKRVEEERFLRVSVEREVMKMFIWQHSQADIDCLKDSIQRQSDCIASGDFRAFLVNDDDFHDMFYRAVNKFWCAKTIDSVSGHYRRFRLISIIDQSISQNILSQHEEMIEAIIKGNEQRLIEIFDRHLKKLDEEGPTFCRKFPYLFERKATDEEQKDTLGDDFLHLLVGKYIHA